MDLFGFPSVYGMHLVVYLILKDILVNTPIINEISVKIIFSNVLDPYTPDGLWSLHELFGYYKHNLGRFTNLIIHQQLDDIFRPGKNSPEASNNIEKILQYVDANFQPTLNATADK